MLAIDPIIFILNRGYHYEEEAKGKCFAPRDNGGGGRRWSYNARKPQNGHMYCMRRPRCELAFMELTPTHSASSEAAALARVAPNADLPSITQGRGSTVLERERKIGPEDEGESFWEKKR